MTSFIDQKRPSSASPCLRCACCRTASEPATDTEGQGAQPPAEIGTQPRVNGSVSKRSIDFGSHSRGRLSSFAGATRESLVVPAVTLQGWVLLWERELRGAERGPAQKERKWKFKWCNLGNHARGVSRTFSYVTKEVEDWTALARAVWRSFAGAPPSVAVEIGGAQGGLAQLSDMGDMDGDESTRRDPCDGDRPTDRRFAQPSSLVRLRLAAVRLESGGYGERGRPERVQLDCRLANVPFWKSYIILRSGCRPAARRQPRTISIPQPAGPRLVRVSPSRR